MPEQGFKNELSKAMFSLSNPTETKPRQVLRSVLSQCSFPFVKEMTTGVFCTPRDDEVGKALQEAAPFLLEFEDI